MLLTLPPTCEQALLERFLRAEAMALSSVRAAQGETIPPDVLTFLRRHEEDEREHLAVFERLLQAPRWEKTALPRVPSQWGALAVHLYGYETLGLEFAALLVHLRPDLGFIIDDERRHVTFFERQVRRVLDAEDGNSRAARVYAQGWWRRLPTTVHRYLGHSSLEPLRAELQAQILSAIERRFCHVGLLGAL